MSDAASTVTGSSSPPGQAGSEARLIRVELEDLLLPPQESLLDEGELLGGDSILGYGGVAETAHLSELRGEQLLVEPGIVFDGEP